MKDSSKTKDQLIEELSELRKKVSELEKSASKHMRTEEELRTERDFLSTAINTQSDTFFIFDSSTGKALRWNRSFSDISGYSDEEIGSMKAPESYYSDEDLKKAANATQSILANGKATIELSLITKDGNRIPTEYTASIIKDGTGNPSHIISIGRDLRDRKKVEEALGVQDERFRSVLENSPTIIFIKDLDSRYLFINRLWEKVFQVSKEDVVGKFDHEVFSKEMARAVRENDLKVIEADSPLEFEEIVPHDDGLHTYISNKFPLYDLSGKIEAICGIATDITERERVSEALREGEEKYSSLFKNMLNGFAYHKIVVDKENRPVDYVFLEVNDCFETLTGLKREDIIGRGVKEVIPDIEKSEFDWIGEYGKIALEGGELRFEQYFEPLDKWYSILGYSNKKGYFAAVFEEITARKRADELIKKSLAEKEVLLKEIHHRVKNNLQIISSMLNLQGDYIEDKELKEIFKESQNRIKSMALVHEQLYRSRDFSSISSSGYLKVLIADIFKSYAQGASLVKLNMDVEDVRLDVDTSMVLGLLLNELCTNTLKHAFPDGKQGEFHVNLKCVDDDNYRLTVSDNGVGLFEGFEIDKTDSIGFLLVKSMVEQIDGTLEIDQSSGTSFEITFSR